MKSLDKREGLLVEYVEQLDEAKVLELANQLLDQGIEPLRLLELVNEGMSRVGKLYERKDYYIADLIMAGLIFKQVLDLERMSFPQTMAQNDKLGKVLLGTVKGDIHDIGKDIFRGMLETHGFEVIDLGVDVPIETFVKKTLEHKPDILGLSGVLTSTVDTMKEVLDAIIAAGLRDQVKIIVGGNHLTLEACNYIGADEFVNDATVGVRVCEAWMSAKKERGTANDNQSSLP